MVVAVAVAMKLNIALVGVVSMGQAGVVVVVALVVAVVVAVVAL
jgi:hypothetical protein